MTGPGARLPETAAVLAVRRGVRQWVAARGGRVPVVVGLSGGADSLALAAAAVVEAGPVTAVVVDHRGLGPGAAERGTRRKDHLQIRVGLLIAQDPVSDRH